MASICIVTQWQTNLTQHLKLGFVQDKADTLLSEGFPAFCEHHTDKRGWIIKPGEIRPLLCLLTYRINKIPIVGMDPDYTYTWRSQVVTCNMFLRIRC